MEAMMGILVVVLFIAWLTLTVATHQVTIRRKRKPWWEAPPFPLENEDRMANWARRRWRL